MKKLTIISHIYNEEYLLPWWIKHHKDIADNIVFIDYHSTDRSVEIMRDMCPNCTIIKSRNEKFDAELCDQEVMSVEEKYQGFKLALNVTEFFIPKDDINHIFDQTEQRVYRINRALMVDENENDIVLHSENLVERKRFGFIGSDPLHTPFRYAHNYQRGNYTLGRHDCHLPNHQDINSLIFVYTWAPWTEEFIKRKLQIKDNIPDADKASGRGYHHFWTYENMLGIKEHFLSKSQYIQ